MTQLRDKSGNLIGLLETAGNQTNIRTPGGQLLGWYDRVANVTRGANGQLVGTGDLTVTLLR